VKCDDILSELGLDGAKKLILTPSDVTPYLAAGYLNGVKYFSDNCELVKSSSAPCYRCDMNDDKIDI
jgi:hypothetical protein